MKLYLFKYTDRESNNHIKAFPSMRKRDEYISYSKKDKKNPDGHVLEIGVSWEKDFPISGSGLIRALEYGAEQVSK